MDNSKGITIADAENAVKIDGDKAVFKRTQDLGKHFLSNLAAKRIDTANSRMGDFHHVASIPTVIIEKWMTEGFNIYDKNVTAKDIIKRLQSLDMMGLMATSKRIV
ncbi:hypothetical protein ACQKOE_09915 [Novosphingobium sp. NPDC080210]|uniref:hypothetical protein n=1 Tax=Novosphingobium sp. NPDC080210 TaxID=3390596 RepID=UPI003D064859